MEKPFPAYNGEDPYVFVCYAHEDSDAVYPEIAWLREQGINLWYDEGISAGTVWRAEIADALERASIVLFYVSKSSLSSDHCNREVNYALDQGKRFVPAYLEDVELTPDLRIGLSRVQALHRSSTSESSYKTNLLAALSNVPTLESTPGNGITKFRYRPIVIGGLMVAAAVSLLYAVGVDHEPVLPDRSVAVNPPRVIGDDPGTQAFAVSVSTGIANHLNRYGSLKLIAPTGNQTAAHASYLVLTNVQLSGESATVDVRLVRQIDNVGVWSNTFGTNFEADQLMSQSSLVRTIARFLRGQIVTDTNCQIYSRRTNDSRAAEFLCSAMWEQMKFGFEGNADWQLIRSNAAKALDLDPDYAGAHQVMSTYYNNQADTNPRPGAQETGLTRASATELARQHAFRALELDPEDPWSHAEMANVALQLDLDYEAAVAGFQTALSMNPADPNVSFWHTQIARSHLYRGDLSTALDHFRRALSVDGSLALTYQAYARALAAAGYWKRAIDACDAGLDVVSTGWDNILFRLLKSGALNRLGETESARSIVDEAWEEFGHVAPALFPLAFAGVGQVEEARQITAALAAANNTNSGSMVLAYVASQDLDNAFVWLRRAIDDRNQFLVQYIRVESDNWLATMRTDPRWTGILEHLERTEAESREAARMARSQ